MKDIKILHSFSVDREKEVEKTESKIENGEEVKVTKKVKELVPVQFALKKPTRREREAAEMYYAAYVGDCVKKGLLTRAMLMNKYQDSGGEVTKEEAKYLQNIYYRSLQAENQLQRLNLEKEKDEEAINETMAEIVAIRRQLVDFQTSRNLLYKDTAEAKAESRVILWLLLYLTYYREGEKDEWVPLFKGFELEEKLESFDDISENGEDFYDEVIEKMTTYVTLLYLGSAKVAEDFARFDKDTQEEAKVKKPVEKSPEKETPVEAPAPKEKSPTKKKEVSNE